MKKIKFLLLVFFIPSTSLLSQNIDCNGIIYGPAMVDTCGTCHKAYVYNFVTHNVVFLNDTSGLLLGLNEMLVFPNNPSNPYWNNCSLNIDCNGFMNGPAMVDTCGNCHRAYLYDFVTHDVVFLNDTNGVIIGSTEMLIFPNNPSNPYWNVCDSVSTYLNPNDIKLQRNLIDVLDVYGRKSRIIPNTLLFFIYDNGTIEKRILIN